MLCSIGYIWWPYAFLSNCPLVNPLLPCMTFKSSDVLHSGQRFLLPNLVAIGDFQVIWPLVDSNWPCMTFDPSNALYSGRGFFLPNLVAIWHFKANWHLDDSGCPLHDLWPQLLGQLRPFFWVNCAHFVKSWRLSTVILKYMNYNFLICHILWHFQDGRHWPWKFHMGQKLKHAPISLKIVSNCLSCHKDSKNV